MTKTRKPTTAQIKVLQHLAYPETLLNYYTSENPYVEGQIFEFARLVNETLSYDPYRYPTVLVSTFRALKKAGWIDFAREWDRNTEECGGRKLKGYESYWVISEAGREALNHPPDPKPAPPDYEWAWQPFGPDQSVMCFSRLGHHYRGFPVVKVTEEQRKTIRAGSRFEFKYKTKRYIAESGIVTSQ